jgi:predicted transcriptional regulator
MTVKVRREVYIEPEQDERLQRVAEASGRQVSDVIEEAVEQYIGPRKPPIPDRIRQEAWASLLADLEQQASRGPSPGGRTWTRDDLYEERLSRYGPQRDT